MGVGGVMMTVQLKIIFFKFAFLDREEQFFA